MNESLNLQIFDFIENRESELKKDLIVNTIALLKT